VVTCTRQCQCHCTLPLPGLVARLFLQSPGRPTVRGQLEVKSPIGKGLHMLGPALNLSWLSLRPPPRRRRALTLLVRLVVNLVARGCGPV
jgi:hypothetical protein